MGQTAARRAPEVERRRADRPYRPGRDAGRAHAFLGWPIESEDAGERQDAEGDVVQVKGLEGMVKQGKLRSRIARSLHQAIEVLDQVLQVRYSLKESPRTLIAHSRQLSSRKLLLIHQVHYFADCLQEQGNPTNV